MKTIFDAVNEFKGVWPYDEANNMILCIDSYSMYEKGSFESYTCDQFSGLNTLNWVEACNKEEFNALVAEMETNFGDSVSYAEYIAICNRQTITDRFPALKSKLVFTQEQSDNGELPYVGAEYLDEDGQVNTCVFIHGVVIIGELKEHPEIDEYLPLTQSIASKIKPLTPPIVLEDGKAYQFDYHSGKGVHGVYSKPDEDGFAVFNFNCGSINKELVTNIVKLVPEVKS